VAALAFGFASSGRHAQSTKFTADWKDGVVVVSAETVSGGSASYTDATGGTGIDNDLCVLAEATLTMLHVA
jgi:hypothetical protein